MNDERKPEGIPIGPFPGGAPARDAGTPVRPGDRPGPATAREKALEHTIEKIKGLGTMRELKAAGIHFELRTNCWRVVIAGMEYDRCSLRDIIAIIGRCGTPDNRKGR